MENKPIENIKFLLLEQSLEMNEYKKEYNAVPFEVYEHLLETTLWLADMHIREEENNEAFLTELSKLFPIRK